MAMEHDLVAEMFGHPLLSDDEESRIHELQSELFGEFRVARHVTYMGEHFDVHPGVFPPRPDSIVLVQQCHVRPGQRVLDVGTGCGVVAVFAARKMGWTRTDGAGTLLLTDVSSAALENARVTLSERFPFCRDSEVVEYVLTTDVFPQHDAERGKGEMFDVILANLPFSEVEGEREIGTVERSMWDPGLTARRTLLREGRGWLHPNGRLYMTVANFQCAAEIAEMVLTNGWESRVLGRRVFHPLERTDPGISLTVACVELR